MSGWLSIRGLRRQRALTQQQLAERAKIGVRTVRALESGNVRSPQRASLERLADAFELSPRDRRLFLHAWARNSHTASFAEQSEAAVDIESVLDDKNWADHSQRAISISMELVVDDDGRHLSQTEQRVTEVDGRVVPYRWALFGNSDDIDVSKIAVAGTVGAELGEQILLKGPTPSDDIMAFQWRISPRLRPGDRWYHAVTLDFAAAATDREPDTRWLIGNRLSPSLLTMILRFQGRTPAQVWEAGGRSQSAIARLNVVAAQSDGVYTLIYRDPAPGLHGFEWAW